MVLKFVLNTGGAPKPVDARGPTVVNNPSLPGNPIGPTGPMGPRAQSFPGGPVCGPESTFHAPYKVMIWVQ